MSEPIILHASIQNLAGLLHSGQVWEDTLRDKLKELADPQHGLIKHLSDAVRPDTISQSDRKEAIERLWAAVCSCSNPDILTVDPGPYQVDPRGFFRNLRGLIASARAVRAMRHGGDWLTLLDEAFQVYNPGAAEGNAQITDVQEGEFGQILAYCNARRLEQSPYVISPMQDCLEELLGQPKSRVVMSFTQPVVYVGDRGYTAALDVTLLKDGHGHQYADPLTTGLMLWTQEFQESIETAWNLATKSAADEGLEYRSFDVRWQLRGQVRRESGKIVPLLPPFLDGRSLGAALGVAFTQILRQSPPDPRCAITGALNADGSVTGVGDVYKKTFAALMTTPADCEDPNRHPIVRVIVPKENKTEALGAAQEVKWSYEDAVELVDDLQTACERSSRLLAEVLAYLEQTAKPASVLTNLHKGAKGSVDSIHQTVQVIEERSNHEDWLARRRKSMPGVRHGLDAQERLAYFPLRSRPELDEGNRDRPILNLWSEDLDNRDRPMPVPWSEDLLRRYPRMVLLGDPGSGKSWCLRNLARQLAQKALHGLTTQEQTLDEIVLPLLWRLTNLNRSDGPVQEAITECDIPGWTPTDTFRKWLARKLEQHGKLALFLDGWDEVTREQARLETSSSQVANTRQRLAEGLENFARSRTFAGTSIVMASRIVGYGGSPIPNAQELELLAFDWSQVEDFAEAWFGNDEARTFLADVQQNPQIQGLARIPLMLTLLCRCKMEQPEGTLPARRGELYDRCLKGLLKTWPEEKEKGSLVDAARLDVLLERLEGAAFRLFLEDYEQFDVRALRRMIGGLEEAAPRMIAKLRKAGILIELGEQLSFLHRTFHEYLAAKHLANLVNEYGWEQATVSIPHRGTKVSVAELLDHKAWLPTWSQVIILLSGELRDPRPLLELLGDRDQDDYHRHRLCLAAQCLPELGEPQRISLQKDLIDITTCLFWISSDREHKELTRAVRSVAQIDGQVRIGRLPENLQEILCAQGFDRNGCPKLLDVVAHLVRAKAVGCDLLEAIAVDAASPAVVSIMFDLVGSVEDEVRMSAARALGLLRPGSSAWVVDALVGRLIDRNARVFVRILAADALGKMRLKSDPGVVQVLLGRVEDREDWAVRVAAIDALGEMRLEGHQQVVRALLDRLDDRDDDNSVRQAAISVLGKMRLKGQSQVVQALLDRLKDREEADDLVMAAVDVLGEMHLEGQPQVVQALLDRLDDRDEDPGVTLAAAEALASMRLEGQSQVVQALLDRLDDRDEDDDLVLAVAKVFGTMCLKGHPQVVQALLDRLTDGKQDRVLRKAAAYSLKRMCREGHPQVVQALLTRRDDRDEDMSVRQAAANVLGTMGLEGEPRVIQAMLSRLTNQGENLADRLVAVDSLGRMSLEGEPRVVQALLDRLDDRNDWLVSVAAEHALGRMRLESNPQIVQAMMSRADKPQSVLEVEERMRRYRVLIAKGFRFFVRPGLEWFVQHVDNLAALPAAGC